MSEQSRKLLQEIHDWSREDKRDLVDELLADGALDEDLAQVLDRRSRDVDAGRVVPVPADDAHRQLRERLRSGE